MVSKLQLVRFLTVTCVLLTLAGKPTSQPSSQPAIESKKDQPPRIVYVMDFSGSMINKGKTARAFAKQEIAALSQDKQFNLILANGHGCVTFKRVMTPATDAAKTAAGEFLDHAEFLGTDDLLNALRIAKKLDSDISILTDGDVGNPKAIAEFLKSIPASRQVRLELFDSAKVSEELVKELTQSPDRRAVEIVHHPLDN